MREMLELLEAIERQRSRVNAMIEYYGTDDENVIRENYKLDRLIERYYELEAQEEEELVYQED